MSKVNDVLTEFYGVPVRVHGDLAHVTDNMAAEIVKLRDERKARDAVIRQLRDALGAIAEAAPDDKLPNADTDDYDASVMFQKIAGGRRNIAQNALLAIAPLLRAWGLE